MTYRQRSCGKQAAWSRESLGTSTQSAEKQKKHLRRSSTHVGCKPGYPLENPFPKEGWEGGTEGLNMQRRSFLRRTELRLDCN